MTLLKNCVREFNPFAKFSNAQEAHRAARLGAFPLIGSAGQSIISTLFLRSDPEDLKALMIKAEGPVSLEAAVVNETLYTQVVPLVTMMLWVVTVVTVVLCAVLAWVQWRMATKIIPLLYLLVFALSLLSFVATLADPNLRMLAMDVGSVAMTIVAVLLAVLMLGAYRGASHYHALQGDLS